jgi:hypothetical protein
METLLQILLQCMGLVLPENVVNAVAYLDDEIIQNLGGKKEKGTRRAKQDNRRGENGCPRKGKTLVKEAIVKRSCMMYLLVSRQHFPSIRKCYSS